MNSEENFTGLELDKVPGKVPRRKIDLARDEDEDEVGRGVYIHGETDPDEFDVEDPGDLMEEVGDGLGGGGGNMSSRRAAVKEGDINYALIYKTAKRPRGKGHKNRRGNIARGYLKGTPPDLRKPGRGEDKNRAAK